MEDKKYEKKQLLIRPGLPVEVPKESIDSIGALPVEKEPILNKIGSTVKAYLKEADNLLSGKYSSIKPLAPQHLINPGVVMILCCDDGVIIRYDRKVEDKGIAIGWADGNFINLAPILSENVVHCHYPDQGDFIEPKFGPQLTISATNSETGKSKLLSSVKIGFNIAVKEPTEELPQPPRKPYCLLSVQNSLEFNMIGEMIQEQGAFEEGQRFLTRTLIKLPVGWECFEVFPFLNIDHWNPKHAGVWAENDILASALRHQLRESELNSLDPKAAARKQFSILLNSYKELLDSDPDREEILQSFLKKNSVLLFPAKVKTWPKLAIGAKKTDFVFKDATGDYLLVELEKSTDKLFLKNGHASSKLNQAHGQIIDWKRYIEDNLSTVQRELGVDGISANPKSLIVIGRSKDLDADNRRKLIAIENDCPKLKIMTYDDVLENAKSVIENLLGPLWAEMGTTEVYYLPQKWITI